jgi:hypothetical protein
MNKKAKEKPNWWVPFIENEVDLLNDINRENIKLEKRSYY